MAKISFGEYFGRPLKLTDSPIVFHFEIVSGLRGNLNRFPTKIVEEIKLSGTEKNEFINECSNPGLIDVTTWKGRSR